jgi:MFS family permease
MIDVSRKCWLKCLLFGSLYFSEGLQLTLATVIVPIYLLDQGLSIPMATLIAGVTAAPWYLKFVFAPIVDHLYTLGKKPFIIIGGLLGGIGLFFVIFFHPSTSLVLFSLVLVLSHIGIVFVDVSCDGWAIQIATDTERGKINGAMTAGMFAGMTLASSVLAPIAEIYGYNFCFIIGSILILVTLIFPFVVHEEKLLKRAQKIVSILKAEFKKGTTQLVSCYCVVHGIGFGLLIFAIPLYMKTILHLNVGEIGLIMSIYPISLVTGALLGGALADKWGVKKILFAFMSVSIVFSAALIFADTWLIVAVLYGIIGFLQGGGLYAAGGALLMQASNRTIGTTHYSIYASIGNFSEFGFGAISGS